MKGTTRKNGTADKSEVITKKQMKDETGLSLSKTAAAFRRAKELRYLIPDEDWESCCDFFDSMIMFEMSLKLIEKDPLIRFIATGNEEYFNEYIREREKQNTEEAR